MTRMQKTLFFSVLASELGHVFCCVLPVILSLLSLFSAFGALSLVPAVIWEAHDFMHRWEIVIISISAVLLALGWWIALYLQKTVQDNHENCTNSHCADKSVKKTRLVLIIATVLFAFNFSVYALVHKDGAPLHIDEGQQHHPHHH